MTFDDMVVGRWYEADHKTRPWASYQLRLLVDGTYDIAEVLRTHDQMSFGVDPAYVQAEFWLRDPK